MQAKVLQIANLESQVFEAEEKQHGTRKVVAVHAGSRPSDYCRRGAGATAAQLDKIGLKIKTSTKNQHP